MTCSPAHTAPAAPRHAALAVVLALVLAACSGSGDGPPSAGPRELGPTADATDTAGPQAAATPAAYTTTDCDEPPDAFALLCSAHELIRDRHVDAPSDEVLAAAAAAGVARGAGAGAGAGGPFSCALPAPAFTALCDALAMAGGENADAVQAAVRGMVAGSLDPYSAYQDPEERARARASLDGSVEGIGALVTSEQLASANQPTDGDGETCTALSPTCAVVIVSVFDNSPAARGGLAGGDRIVAVDGTPVDGDTLGGVVERVRGPAGTEVELGIHRDGQLRKIRLTRAAVDIPVLETADVGDVAYLRLGLFTSDADETLRAALADLLDDGTGVVLLDLRGNPGGALDTAIAVASEFLTGGDVVRTESPDVQRSYRVERGGLATDRSIDVYVVVDGASASASEVVASALQEAGRATVVGETTFGKDTVQQTFDLGDGGALKLTIARWRTAGGHGFDAGVSPDVPLDLTGADTAEDVVEAVLAAVASRSRTD